MIPRPRDFTAGMFKYKTTPEGAPPSDDERMDAVGGGLVVLVGQKKADAIAVRNVSGRRRWSKLSEWLSAAPSASRLNGMAS
jgi:hypothetical protein